MRFSFIVILLVLVGLMKCTVAKAQEQVTLSLSECIELALQNNNQLKLKQLKLDLERNEYVYKRRFFIPDIEAYARYFQYLDNFPVYVFPQNENVSLSGPVQLGAPLNFYSGVKVNQTMFDTRLINGRSLRIQSEQLLDKQTELNQDETIFEVSRKYYEIGIINQGKEILAFNSERLDKMLSIATVSVENSLAPKSTIAEIQLRKEELKLKQKELDFGISQLKNYLKLLCGIEENFAIELALNEDLPDVLPIEELDSLQIKESEIISIQKELNQRSILHEGSKTYPTLDLFLAFQWLQQEGYGELFSAQSQWFNQHFIGLQLNIPIVSSEDRKSLRQTVKIRNELLEVQKDIVDQSSRIKREKAMQDLQISRDAMDIAEKKVALQETKYNEQEAMYNESYATLPDLLDTEEQLRSAKMEYNQKKLEYFIAILEVYKVYGIIKSISEGP